METIRRISNAVSRVLQRVEMCVGCSCLALMLALMLTNAIARYLFDFPIVWSDELNNFFFVWLGFMACAYIMGNDSHMSVTGLVSLLPRRSKYIVKTLMNVIMIVVLAAYVPGFFTLMKRVTFSGLLRIPLKYVYSILPISFVLMIVHIVNNVINDTCGELDAGRNKKEA